MEDLLDKALEYAIRKNRFAEVRFFKSEKNSILMKNGTLSGTGYSSDGGLAIRVINSSISFGAINKNKWEDVKDEIDRISARATQKGRNSFSRAKEIRDEWRVEQKKKIEDISFEEKTERLKEVDSMLSEEKMNMRLLSLSDNIERETLLNSEGTRIMSTLPKVGFTFFMAYMEGGNYEQGYFQLGYSGGYEALDYWRLHEVMKHESKVLKNAVKATKLKEGNYDLVIGPEVSGIVAHESAGHPSESDRIIGREMAQAGESFIKEGDRGRRVGSDIVNLVDDPTVEHSYGHYRYDRDGVKARKTYLYKEGLINEFLSNRESAGRLNMESNGASRSSEWDKEPLVRMSTTYIEPRDYSVEELVEEVKEGIYMRSFTEWNIDDIRFNEKYVGREAYHIVDGEIKEVIRRPVIETTTTKFYSSMDAIGKDLDFVAGTCGKGDPMQGVDVWMGGPHVRLRNIFVR
ncbi:MAG: TldD/PmbA family protein [Candidatus Thermoplasmatota archaeon]|jgi:TldD protein|nr:TldD/PmbA family protein [Candidatus Thermoplasmatota archaeon]MCL5681307.1 TldD/PmbA family protein [Candidatus Thermoplasmatota archaeon]